MDGSVDGFAGPRATLKAITVATRTDKKKNDDFGTVYRGHEGQWSWLFHRVTGVAIILFLFAHIVDTAVIGWGPEAYDKVTAAYKNPLVHLLELGLVTAVLYHSLNGLKITLIDFFPSLAGHIKALGRTTVLRVRALHDPGGRDHGQADPGPVVRSPMATTIDRSQPSAGAPEPQRDMRGGRERPIGGFELWAWLFMRISGLVLLVLAVGHTLIMHLPSGGVDRVDFGFVAARWAKPVLAHLGLDDAHAGPDPRHQRPAQHHAGLRAQARRCGSRSTWSTTCSGFTLLILGTVIVVTFDPTKWGPVA